VRPSAQRRFATIAAAFLLAGSPIALAQPATTSNADSCDVAVTPAATLLLPYFEVDTAAAANAGSTTLFTITNVSRYPQIAHVTIWTDWALPVLDFNVLLTGYDVRGVNLFDVIVRGVLDASGATGAAPFESASNPNFATGELRVEATCAGLPKSIPPDLATAVKNALTIGTGYPGCTGPVGGLHPAIAKGYVTVDVASYCSSRLPTDPGGAYFHGTGAPILFDNVLIGDYQQVGPTPALFGAPPTLDAQGGPMVHIRAVPEGGLSGASGGQLVQTNLPFTFYDRYTPSGARAADRRQPLPSMWAARFIQGGTGEFATDFKIWREGVTAGLPACSNTGSVQNNSLIAITSMIRFDEHENSTAHGLVQICCFPQMDFLPAASRTSTASAVYPPMFTPDLGGWMFLNLSSGSQHLTAAGRLADETLTAQRPGFGPKAPGTGGSRTTTQNWVSASMYGAVGANRLSVDFAAGWLGNGCTPADLPGATIGGVRPVNP
jgi:hypothetical protein